MEEKEIPAFSVKPRSVKPRLQGGEPIIVHDVSRKVPELQKSVLTENPLMVVAILQRQDQFHYFLDEKWSRVRSFEQKNQFFFLYL